MDVLIGLGAACLLIRVGLGLYRTGLLRAKNAAGAVLRIYSDLSVSALAFWLIGGAILLQNHNAYFGVRGGAIVFSDGATPGLFFLMTVVLLGTGIVGGAVAERARFFPLWSTSAVLAGLVIPLGANWSWNGWLARLGFIDTAGGTWLHLSGAIFATVGAIAIGPRTGKYHRDGSASMVPGHNIPLAGIGVLLMLAGWAPYLIGCLFYNHGILSTGDAATSTILAGSAAGLAAVLVGRQRYGKPDVILTVIGFLGGLVSITPGAGYIAAPWAVLIGAVAGIIVPLAAIWIDLIARIDDPVSAIAIHGIGGLWGTIATGIFVHGSAIHRLHQIGLQFVGILAIGLLALLVSVGLFTILKATVRLRVTEADEYDGLDLAEHDIGAYPDFQQNTIKSYHLREA